MRDFYYKKHTPLSVLNRFATIWSREQKRPALAFLIHTIVLLCRISNCPKQKTIFQCLCNKNKYNKQSQDIKKNIYWKCILGFIFPHFPFPQNINNTPKENLKSFYPYSYSSCITNWKTIQKSINIVQILLIHVFLTSSCAISRVLACLSRWFPSSSGSALVISCSI